MESENQGRLARVFDFLRPSISPMNSDFLQNVSKTFLINLSSVNNKASSSSSSIVLFNETTYVLYFCYFYHY